MKISKILIASTLVLALACGKKSTEEAHEHGPDSHEHVDEEHSHEDGDHSHDTTSQEEFAVQDTTGTHTHEDGEKHKDH